MGEGFSARWQHLGGGTGGWDSISGTEDPLPLFLLPKNREPLPLSLLSLPKDTIDENSATIKTLAISHLW